MFRAFTFVILGLTAALAVFWSSRLPVPRAREPTIGPKQPARQVDLGRYYRFKLDLTYKKAPIHIEFVGGCGVHYAFSVASGGSTLETIAMSAFVFAARMPEGHAIVVRSNPVWGSANVCYGATTLSSSEVALLSSCTNKHECIKLRIAARQKLAPDWLPLITWYERDDDFAFGIAYATQDAYASPRARFGFVKATVEHATRADFDAFEREGPRNLWPGYLTDSLSHYDTPYFDKVDERTRENILRDPRKAWPFASWASCRGARVVKLNEAQRVKISALWPPSHPLYWLPPESSANHVQLTSEQSRNVPETFDLPDTAARKSERPTIYPVAISEGLAEAGDRSAPDEWYNHDLLINDSTLLGFQYCEFSAPQLLLDQLRHGSAPNIYRRGRCRIEGVVMPVNTSNCELGVSKFFIRDEYAVETESFIN